jgi:integrase
VLVKPDAEHPKWRAEWDDPDSGKRRRTTLERVDAKTFETREAWAVAKSEQLQRAHSDRNLGIARPIDVTFPKATEAYIASGGKRGGFEPGTVRTYTDALEAFASIVPVTLTRELTVAHLATFAESRRKTGKRIALAGGKRGATRARGLRSVHSVNKELRAVKSFLRWARKAHGVQLSRDEIAEGLEAIRVVTERRDFLRPEQIRELLDACAKHDAKMFDLTREEHDGKREPGTTPKFKPIAPFVRFLLLTGLRVSEALEVEWRDVEDDRIHIRAAVAKTKQIRDVDLSVAPTALPRKRRAASERIFDFTADEVRAAQRRTIEDEDFDAPEWSPQALRRTCSTYFTNAFNAWRSAKSVGHSVLIAERHYAGLVKVPAGVTTLEQAMGIA